MKAIAVLALLFLGTVFADPDTRITKLPGASFPINFKQFAGYLDASETHKVFYWFVESENKADDAPLVLWLNGGPGCSSLLALFQENGPFLLGQNGQAVTQNSFSWNKKANILFLEAPAGVGFSYSTDGNVKTNDNQTAEENYRALKQFLQLYPEHNHRDLYLAGEDYAGFFVPTLASWLIKDKDIQLKGLIIGNGFISAQAIYNNLPPFLYYHNLISEEHWTELKSCCKSAPEDCDFFSFMKKQGSEQCYNATIRAVEAAGAYGTYDAYYSCDAPSKAMTLTQMITNIPLTRKAPRADPNQCKDQNRLGEYLNRKDVQTALRIKSPVKWALCNMRMHGGPPTDLYVAQYENMDKQFADIFANSQVRVLIYNGDTDTFMNSVSNQKYAKSLNRKELEPMRPWKYQPTEPHYGGMVTRYDRLDFVTIRAAGHQAPLSKPGQMFQIFSNFLQNKPYDQAQ